MVIVLQVWGRHTGCTYCYYFYITDGDSSTGMGETHRVHLLLQFMEHLEKQLYNAYEGCAVAIVNPPKVRITVVNTNIRIWCKNYMQ